MSAPAAIRAVYADYRRVKGRKVHQLVLEIPSELWPEAYSMLGEPNIETSDWFAVARLQPPAEKWTPAPAMHPAKEAALVCQKPTFWTFLQDVKRARCEGEEDAATYVRRTCGVNTRADFATNARALDQWHALHGEYEGWMAAGGAA